MPYYDIPSYAEYEGVYDQDDLFEGACTWIACLIPDDVPPPFPEKQQEQSQQTEEDFPF